MGIVMILSICYCISLVTLQCYKFGIVKKHALFRVTFCNLNSWLLKQMTFCKSGLLWEDYALELQWEGNWGSRLTRVSLKVTHEDFTFAGKSLFHCCDWSELYITTWLDLFLRQLRFEERRRKKRADTAQTHGQPRVSRYLDYFHWQTTGEKFVL